MIVVFVVDTSTSMGLPVIMEEMSTMNKRGMSRLDLAKMAVESLSKGLDKRIIEHNRQVQQESHSSPKMYPPDQFLLLSTGRQYEKEPGTDSCSAGGRLLVGFGDIRHENSQSEQHRPQVNRSHGGFERELKRMKVTSTDEGSSGLNIALSTGLQILSRYRLQHRWTENFGMGLLVQQIQPACLILLTDGECVTDNSLQLKFGHMPLREFYKEPFRWDQRLFCVRVGAKSSALHSSLRVLCEVTGGGYISLKSAVTLNVTCDALLRQIAPSKPKHLVVPEPLKIPDNKPSLPSTSVFVNGGPVCAFQLFPEELIHRAMLLHLSLHQNPTWCIPESFFPNKKLDTLPPRKAQPLLTFSRTGIDPHLVMKSLNHLDKLTKKKKMLQRDVYLCEWLGNDGNQPPWPVRGQEFFSVCVRGAGRPSQGEDNFLYIGILFTTKTFSTITLLPPDPHILLPLLISAIEAKKDVSSEWRSEFRSYLYRIPPYYLLALRRCLRPLLPSSVHFIIGTDITTIESIPLLCFSRVCLNKIRTGEQIAKEQNERIDRQEEELRRSGTPLRFDTNQDSHHHPTHNISSYLASLRTMPAPWRVNLPRLNNTKSTPQVNNATNEMNDKEEACHQKDELVTRTLGELPANCLLAFYDSRRRWIHGNSSLTTRGLSVEGVLNDGESAHHYGVNHTIGDEPILTVAGVGASTLNRFSVSKMGDYRERLLWSRVPVVGYGGSDTSCSAATVSPDGSPRWSVTDDSLPAAFFDPKTGQFVDSLQTRVKARLMINFGNPFKDKRGDAIVPELFQHQRPPLHREALDQLIATPPGSPPHDDDLLREGEGEAVFAERIPSPPRSGNSSDQITLKRRVLTLSDIGRDRVAKKQAQHVLDHAKPPKPLSDIDKDRTAKKQTQHVLNQAKHSVEEKTKPPRPHANKEHAKQSVEKPKPPFPPKVSQLVDEKPRPPRSFAPKVKQSIEKPKPPRPHVSTLNMNLSKPKPPLPKKENVSQLPQEKPKPPRPQVNNFPPKAKKSSEEKPRPPQAHKEHVKQSIEEKPRPPVPSKNNQSIDDKLTPPPPTSQVSLSHPKAKQSVDEKLRPPKPQVNLPPSWMCVWSKSQKRWYFFDTMTNKSVWEWPPNTK